MLVDTCRHRAVVVLGPVLMLLGKVTMAMRHPSGVNGASLVGIVNSCRFVGSFPRDQHRQVIIVHAIVFVEC